MLTQQRSRTRGVARFRPSQWSWRRQGRLHNSYCPLLLSQCQHKPPGRRLKQVAFIQSRWLDTRTVSGRVSVPQNNTCFGGIAPIFFRKNATPSLVIFPKLCVHTYPSVKSWGRSPRFCTTQVPPGWGLKQFGSFKSAVDVGRSHMCGRGKRYDRVQFRLRNSAQLVLEAMDPADDVVS